MSPLTTFRNVVFRTRGNTGGVTQAAIPATLIGDADKQPLWIISSFVKDSAPLMSLRGFLLSGVSPSPTGPVFLGGGAGLWLTREIVLVRLLSQMMIPLWSLCRPKIVAIENRKKWCVFIEFRMSSPSFPMIPIPFQTPLAGLRLAGYLSSNCSFGNRNKGPKQPLLYNGTKSE